MHIFRITFSNEFGVVDAFRLKGWATHAAHPEVQNQRFRTLSMIWELRASFWDALGALPGRHPNVSFSLCFPYVLALVDAFRIEVLVANVPF